MGGDQQPTVHFGKNAVSAPSKTARLDRKPTWHAVYAANEHKQLLQPTYSTVDALLKSARRSPFGVSSLQAELSVTSHAMHRSPEINTQPYAEKSRPRSLASKSADRRGEKRATEVTSTTPVRYLDE